MRACILGLALSGLLWGQLQLSLIEGATERPVTEVTDLGSTDASDLLLARFRVRNATSSPVVLRTLSVAGAGFSLASAPSLPLSLAAGASLDFTVRFQAAAPGIYGAVLTVNTVSILLRARATAGLILWLEADGRRFKLAAGDTIDFGRAELGTRIPRRLLAENPHPDPLAVEELAVQGPGFAVSKVPHLPLRLQPGASVVLELAFEPASVGPQAGRLFFNGRAFALAGTGVEPPLPRPRIVLDPPAPGSGRQVRVQIRFSERARSAGEGELRLDFEPVSVGWRDDPAIGFLSPAGRSVRFAVEPGAETAGFGGREEIVMQTGTTAGRLTLTARLGSHVEQATLALAPLPVVVDSARAARTSNSVELNLTGFDNTRSVSQIVFTFYGSDGRMLEPGPIAADVSAEFRRYFESSSIGGIFALRAVFPVTGDTSVVAAVEIELRNAVAAARTSRIGF